MKTKKWDLIAIAVCVVLAFGIALAAEPKSILEQGTTENSTEYISSERWMTTDTTKVNTWVIAAIGEVHAVIKLQVYAGGSWSGYAVLDSFLTAQGDVRVVTGVTNDSIMRVWLPELALVADTTNDPARSYLKQREKFFRWRVVAETKATGNGGLLEISWM